jgi:hypothetical protein
VTRLGDFSPTGRLFEFLEHDKQPNIFGYFYLPKYGKSNAGFFLQKMGRATFWATFFYKRIWSPWCPKTRHSFLVEIDL